MNARASGNLETAPRFDRRFIEEHRLLERYLENKLPLKGALDLEAWCRAHPEYLDELKLSDRTQMSLKLLEAAGRPHDMGEPRQSWWKSGYFVIGVAALCAVFLIALWSLYGRYAYLRSELEDAHAAVDKGSLVQPATTATLRITPDREAGLGRARILVNRAAPQLVELHIDLGYTGKMDLGYNATNIKLAQFRLFVDKQDQGRALVLNNLLKDSNGELRMTLNSTGIAAGIYTARIEAVHLDGSSVPIGWLTLEVR